MKPHESPRINKKSIRGNSSDSWPVRNRGISPRSLLPLFHTRPESHELSRIDKYLDSWLNRTQFVKILTDSHSP